jgi:hypothetical protein
MINTISINLIPNKWKLKTGFPEKAMENIFYSILWSPLTKRTPSKNGCMLLIVASTRYSLVKGERIVRFVLTTQLHALTNKLGHCFKEPWWSGISVAQQYGINQTDGYHSSSA